jgi:transcriptional regulator with GAF, ATPase, and Fis domain
MFDTIRRHVYCGKWVREMQTPAARGMNSNSEKIGTPTVIISGGAESPLLRVQKYKLLIVSGPHQGEEVVINSDNFSIGAGSQNDLILEDASVSRKHCEIQQTPEGFLIRDLNSTNGTIIHGVRICEAYLGEGTELQVGNTKLIFCPLQEMAEYPLSSRESFGQLVGRSIAMRKVFHIAETYAPTDASILIEGETGTGKEILAEAIHAHSRRKGKPFSIIDCGSLASGVIESELFGHVKGAFTGAAMDRTGVFEHANGGTVFLDEIGELGLDLQPKLLRVLEKKGIRRLGSNVVKTIDVRIITATNRKIEKEVNSGRFREDLFYRLSTVKIVLPPLRKRKEDIPLLTRHFLTQLFGGTQWESMIDFQKTMTLFYNYDWPGNVREIRNLLEMAFHGRRDRIDPGACLYLTRMREFESSSAPRYGADQPFKSAKQDLIGRFEKDYVRGLLEKSNWNISRAAREAQIERAYLQRLIKKHDLAR